MRRTTVSTLLGITLAALTFAVPALGAQERERPDFRWEGVISPGNWVKLRNLNGDVRVIPANSDRVEITGVKHWRRGDPDDVRIEVTKFGSNDQNVLVCALWSETAECDEDGYRDRGPKHRERRGNDVSVEFTIRLPRGVRVSAGTVNGEVEVTGATSEVEVSSVNGGVEATTSGGPVRASTVNGSIRASMASLGSDNELEFSTVNGSIVVELPSELHADVRMNTVNGRITSTDYPLTINGRLSPHSLRATIGRGGPTLRFSTVNGSVELRKRG